MKKVAIHSITILSILLFAILLGVCSFASKTVAVSSSEFYTHQGETFTTTIFIPDGANIVDFDISLKYDTELLTLVSIEENEDIKGTIVFNADIAGEIAINYTRTNKNVTTYLPLLDLTFIVDDNIGIGSYDCLSVDTSATYIAHRLNNAGTLDIVDFECEFAPLVIYEMGDVDLSGGVDIGDATYIRRHLAEFEGSILSDFSQTLADTFFDGIIDIADAVTLQRHLARLEVLYGNRVNITFYNKDGEKYATKSVSYGGTLTTIPAVPAEDGFSGGVWSQSATEFIAPVYSNLQSDISLFAYYSNQDDPAMEYYKKVLTNMYYSGDMPTNLNNSLSLQSTLSYQEGRYASLVWSSSSNYILNSTTGVFTKPTYPQELTLTVSIISYDSNNHIEAEGEISFDYLVPGVFLTPTKAAVEEFLKFYFTAKTTEPIYHTTDNTDQTDNYLVNYDVKLISKLNNTVLPVDGALYDNFEIRLAWYQNVDGTLQPISQIKRTTSTQVNDYVAVATFNGKPLEDDGKIYIDGVVVTAIDQLEIKNYIINQISMMGTLATDGKVLWNNDTVYGSTVTWETGNADIGYVLNNGHDQIVKLKDDAITGSVLPINARVTYAVDGGTEEFVLAYNLEVSCDNTIIHAPENMDPGLYKAIKMELEETLGYRGDLTSAALANVKFVNLDLSKYQEMAKEYAILRATHPEQYPDDLYPEITSFRGLSYCKNLRTLNISGISVTDGSMNQIATLSYLEAFIARGCNLDNLSDGGQATLKNATGLKLLDLTDNNFTSLDSVFAEGVRYGSLREVYLSNNRLTDINALSRAPMMTYLSLSGNGLTTEGTASIENYPYLSYLSLANNNIDSVEHIKGLRYLTELRLQNNNLTNVNDLRRLVNLEILYLGHNNIQDITYLNALTNLRVLYVNDNRLFDISALRDLTKLEAINVNNNRLSSLSVLINYKSTLTEIYAENNNVTDFSFINGASNLHILMLSGNTIELAQENMVTWLSNLPEIEILTLSNIRLTDLSFLDSMSKLVRLDVANCGLHAFTGDISNIKCIADRYETLKVLDISNNDFSDNEAEVLKLRSITLLTVLYADNICNNLDAYTLTYSMTELKALSLENCGITTMNWLYKFNNLIYVDLAGNKISNVDFETYISNASLKTLDELYLDTTVPCTFSNAFGIADINVSKLSLEGVSIGQIEKMPYLENIKYLNLGNTGLTNLTGADEELEDLYSLERYSTLETVDLSHLDADISVVENMPSVTTVYAIAAPSCKLFYKDNLHSLQRLYNKGVTCYLYDKDTQYEPVAAVEGSLILNRIDDFSCNIKVASDKVISDNNPFIVGSKNDYSITWSISNNVNYEIKNNYIGVKSYANIDDESLSVTASIIVYPDQAPVTRTFSVSTSILRASQAYLDIDKTGFGENMQRGTSFNYGVSIKAANTEGFAAPVKPVVDDIRYTYSCSQGDYTNVLTTENITHHTIKETAPLNSTTTITADVGHIINGLFIADQTASTSFKVVERSFRVTYHLNGGTLLNSAGESITYQDLQEEDVMFADTTISKTGYVFKGWYEDEALTNLFCNAGATASMPSRNFDLYAKWEAHYYTLHFDANGGTVNATDRDVLCDTPIGTLPTPTKTGYTFTGWYTQASGGTQVTSSSSFATTGTITIYAHWTANTYTVSFNANGGSGSMASQTFTYDTAQSLRSNSFTKTNCAFLGWSTSSTATSATYTNGESVKNLTATANGTVTLYAVWESVSLSATSATLSRTPTGISLNKTSLTLATIATNDYSNTGSITATASGYTSPTKTITATTSTGAAVTWTSSNTNVATVSSSGVITAKGAGTATITATTSKGAKATCSVTVSNTNTSVTWSSNNTAVATISSGTVTAVSKGSATITATMNGYSKTCSVTVGKTYKAIALTDSNAYADFNYNNQGGLFSVYSGANTSFTFTFVTGTTAPADGCLYQCYNSTLKNGFMVTFNSGKVSVTESYNGNAHVQTSDYVLSANTVYTVVVSFTKGTSAPHKGTITIKDESGTVLNTKSCSWNGMGYGVNSSASIGPKSSIMNGTTPNIYLMSISFTGSVFVSTSNISLHSCSMDFSAGTVGTQTFTNNGCTAAFTGTELGYRVLF